MITLTYNGKQYINCEKEFLLAKNVPESVIKDAENKEILLRRQESYRSESDPLYMEWQYDQTPEKEQVWRDKVAEIKTRYPLPSEV